MATNEVYRQGDYLGLTVSHPTTPASGDPVRYGEMTGIATSAEDADGKTSVTFEGVHLVSVKGINGSGDSAVAVGDKIYYVDADTPVLSKKATGRLFGYAVETPGNAGTVTGGATATIGVRLADG